MRKDTPLAVQVPPPDRDGPGWVKVGVIAAVGFVIGIAWPRLMGVKLGPNAPGEASASASASSSAHLAAADPPPASVPKVSASASAAASASATASTGAPQVSVHSGSIISCKTSDGDSKKGKECGSIPALDNVVIPHLKKLATCSAAEGQTGKLSFLANADFPSGRLTWEVGKSSTVGNLEGITSCLKTHFTGVTAAGVAHEHAKYTVSYMTTLAPSADAANGSHPSVADKTDKPDPTDNSDKNAKDDKSADKPDVPVGGEASVGWEVALVRDVPKTGQVVARLPRGTKVNVGAVKDGWFAIKYGDGFTNEGFVYRGALNR